MLVATAITGCRCRNEASDSTASTTMKSPLPRRALLPAALSRPPITKVGSRPPSASTLATRHVALARRDELRIVGLHGTRDDHGVGAVDLLGAVAVEDLHAEPREPAGRGIRREVRAAHLVAEIGEHFGDARHAGAADADEMDASHLMFHRASSMHLWATTRAASGLPSARAFCAIFSSAGRWSAPISSASRSALSSRCGTRMAAPRSARKRAFAVWWSSTSCGKGPGMLAMPPAEWSAMVTAPARQM